MLFLLASLHTLLSLVSAEDYSLGNSLRPDAISNVMMAYDTGGEEDYRRSREEIPHVDKIIYRVPLGLRPLTVMVTNKAVGTHVLTLHRHALTRGEGFSLNLQKLNTISTEKQRFNVRYNGAGGLVLDYGSGMRFLTSYTRDGLLYVGDLREIGETPQMYLKIGQDASPSEDIIVFRIIAGEECLGLSGPYVAMDGKEFYTPMFRRCEADAKDQQWAFFLMKLVQDRLDYDKHLINRHTFNDHKEYLRAHEWPTLNLLINKLHEMGRFKLSTWH